MNKKNFFILALPVVMAACGKSSSNTTTVCTNIAFTAQAPASEKQTLKAFLDTNHITYTSDTSGVCYVILSPGSGTSVPNYCSQVTVDYVGRVLNSSAPPFDQTTSSTGPRTFTLRNLIGGWQIGIPLIKKGGSVRLYIPPSLAYGSAGQGAAVPPDAYLSFDISLVDFTNY